MQIRSLLLLITLLGASLAAISVWVLSYQRETAQLEADAELRWEIYNNAWNKTVAAAEAEISQYGLFSERIKHLSPSFIKDLILLESL